MANVNLVKVITNRQIVVNSGTFNSMDYLLLACGWVVYFALHSLLASVSVKRMAANWFGNGFRYYRLAYSVLATAGLIGLFVSSGSIPSASFFQSVGIVRYVGIFFTMGGVMVIQVAFRQYRLKGFLGFVGEENKLKRNGILAWIRHPIYAGLILLALGFFLFIPNPPTLVSCVCIFSYLPLGIFLEEKKMIREFGQTYIDYRKEVPALIPRWSKLSEV